jgi:hypothetical protein
VLRGLSVRVICQRFSFLFLFLASEEKGCRLRRTVHEVRYEDLEAAFGGDVVGHNARVGERPAEGVGNDDHDGGVFGRAKLVDLRRMSCGRGGWLCGP